MEVVIADRKLKKIIERQKELCREYGKTQAEKITQRINELCSAENLYDISRLPQARLHLLSNNLKGHFAIYVKQPYRMVIFPLNGDTYDLKSITKIKIKEIIDYH